MIIDCPLARKELFDKGQSFASQASCLDRCPDFLAVFGTQCHSCTSLLEANSSLDVTLQSNPTLCSTHCAQVSAKVIVVECIASNAAVWQARLEARALLEAKTAKHHKPRSWAELQALLDRQACVFSAKKECSDNILGSEGFLPGQLLLSWNHDFHQIVVLIVVFLCQVKLTGARKYLQYTGMLCITGITDVTNGVQTGQ